MPCDIARLRAPTGILLFCTDTRCTHVICVGLRVGDTIVEVDGVDVQAMADVDVLQRIKAAVSTLKLTVPPQ